MKDLVLNQILPPVGRQNDIKSLSSRAKTRDLNLPPLVILNPRFLRMKDLVLNQILPPVGRQNDIKSLTSRVKTRDLDLPPLVILNPRFLRMKDLGLEPDSSSRWSSE